MEDDIDLPVNEQARLLTNGFDHPRVTMTGIGHPDAAGEIQVGAAILVVNVTSLGTLRDDGRNNDGQAQDGIYGALPVLGRARYSGGHIAQTVAKRCSLASGGIV